MNGSARRRAHVRRVSRMRKRQGKSREPQTERLASPAGAFEIRDEAVKLQYELLGILDSKAAALLGFDALALAGVSIWLGYVPLNYLHLVLDFVFITLLLSCALLLMIIWLRWAHPGDTEQTLDRIRRIRTKFYRSAWLLSAASVFILIAASVVHTVGTILVATNNCDQECTSFYSDNVSGNLDYRK